MQVRYLGIVDYATIYTAMQTFTQQRLPETPDELWVCQHPPVLTQGIAGKSDHILVSSDIPIVQTNRGGQVTYHGLGQIVAYPLINLHRLNIFVKEYVYRLEEALLATLAHWHIIGHRVAGAPGIYVRLTDPFSHQILPKGDAKLPDFKGLGKIAALGIKVSQGCTYHGVSLNVEMDLSPFSLINPCGYAALTTVDFASFGVLAAPESVMQQLSEALVLRLMP